MAYDLQLGHLRQRRRIVTQEFGRQVVLRHLLRLVILAGEFRTLTGGDPDYVRIGELITGICQQVDGRYTDRFLAADGVVFVVAEYNGSYPGALKLFIDMLPYPEGFDSRPCAFVGLSAGQFQGLRAVEHLQQVAGYRMAHLSPRRCLIGNSYHQFDEDGRLADEELGHRLHAMAGGFLDFIRHVKGPA